MDLSGIIPHVKVSQSCPCVRREDGVMEV